MKRFLEFSEQIFLIENKYKLDTSIEILNYNRNNKLLKVYKLFEFVTVEIFCL